MNDSGKGSVADLCLADLAHEVRLVRRRLLLLLAPVHAGTQAAAEQERRLCRQHQDPGKVYECYLCSRTARVVDAIVSNPCGLPEWDVVKNSRASDAEQCSKVGRHNGHVTQGRFEARQRGPHTVRLVVERVEVAGGVIAGLPVEVELELLGALQHLLLLLLRAQVLRLD